MTERFENSTEPGAVAEFGDNGWAHRRRLERQLHDGPALRLAALSLRLGVCRHRTEHEQAVHECLIGAQDELHAVLQELRDVASQIYPPVLASAGLGVALQALAERVGLPVTVRAPRRRFPAAVEAAAYFEVAEHLPALVDGASALAITVDDSERSLLLTMAAERDGAGQDGAGQNATGQSGTGQDEITVRIPCE
ncbi:histidine kinase [Saccharopolyspora taberi]